MVKVWGGGDFQLVRHEQNIILLSGGGFKYFFICTPAWGNEPI